MHRRLALDRGIPSNFQELVDLIDALHWLMAPDDMGENDIERLAITNLMIGAHNLFGPDHPMAAAMPIPKKTRQP